MKGKRIILSGQIIVTRQSIIREVERINKEALERREKKGKIRSKSKKYVIKILSEKEEEEEDLDDKLA